MKFSVGICVYNEEKNIKQILHSVFSQKLGGHVLSEVLVVASGCTDKTVPAVKKLQKKETKIKLIEQVKREGKASALNLFVKKAKNRNLILLSADTMLEENTFRHLLDSLSQEQVGMSGARVIPINNKDTFIGYAVHLQWRLHHLLNLDEKKQPKIGEIVAFKKIFERIPPSSAVDEASIEPLIHNQSYAVVYNPSAIIYNKGPETILDFIKQRRRIYSGHTALKYRQNYRVSTYSGLKIMKVLIKNLELRPIYIVYTIGAIALEGFSRLLGTIDYFLKTKDHTVWEVSKTTKTSFSNLKVVKNYDN